MKQLKTGTRLGQCKFVLQEIFIIWKFYKKKKVFWKKDGHQVNSGIIVASCNASGNLGVPNVRATIGWNVSRMCQGRMTVKPHPMLLQQLVSMESRKIAVMKE